MVFSNVKRRKRASLDTLPNEMLVEIFRHLCSLEEIRKTLRQLLLCCRVNRRFKEVLCSNEWDALIWKPLCERHWKEKLCLVWSSWRELLLRILRDGYMFPEGCILARNLQPEEVRIDSLRQLP